MFGSVIIITILIRKSLFTFWWNHNRKNFLKFKNSSFLTRELKRKIYFFVLLAAEQGIFIHKIDAFRTSSQREKLPTKKDFMNNQYGKFTCFMVLVVVSKWYSPKKQSQQLDSTYFSGAKLLNRHSSALRTYFLGPSLCRTKFFHHDLAIILWKGFECVVLICLFVKFFYVNF